MLFFLWVWIFGLPLALKANKVLLEFCLQLEQNSLILKSKVRQKHNN
jgi:hypothetical protein